MGNVLKQCGAFFLHRGKNSQDVIYRSVLYTYIKYLITYESSPLQFFIEGTRSRTNKSIHPKFGKYFFVTLIVYESVLILFLNLFYD